METINKNHELGGNLELYIIPGHLIGSISGLNISYADVDPTVEIKCSAESIRYIYKSSITASGTLYEHTVTALVTGRDEQNELLLQKLSKCRLMVILRDSTGQYWRLGDQSEGLKLTVEFDSAADPSASNGYTITISGFLINPPVKANFPLIQA